MPIKAVLFDMFDTLMMIEKDHEFYAPAIQRMYHYLSTRGIDVSFEKFQDIYRQERAKLYAKADITLEEPHFNVRVSQTLGALGYTYPTTSPLVCGATQEFYEEFMKFCRLDPNATSTLKALYGKYKLGIVSNFAIPECVHKLLKADAIDSFFEVVVVSGTINKRKPSPEIFEHALTLMGVSATETAFVGDTVEADIQGAKAMGMRAIYIERRVQKSPERFYPDRTIKSLSELPLALKEDSA